MSLSTLPTELFHVVVEAVRRDRRGRVTIPGLVADARNRRVNRAFRAASQDVRAPGFDALVRFMSSGPIVALALTREDGVNAWLDLLGPDDSQAAALYAVAAGARAREQALPRLFPNGPLALCFVPRWVRHAIPHLNIAAAGFPVVFCWSN